MKYSFFVQPFKNVKIILSLWAIQKQAAGWICLVTFNQWMILVTSPLFLIIFLWVPEKNLSR